MNSTIRPMWHSLVASVLLLAAIGMPLASEESPFYLAAPAFPTSRMKLPMVTAQETPVVRTSPGEWDSVDLLNPSVIYWHSKYWNYYSGFDGQVWRTGIATSTDGLSWNKYEHNPVLSPSEQGWDREYIAANGSALVIKDQLYYYYQGKTGEHITQLGLATSPDGLHFTPLKEPILTPGPAGRWDEAAVADPYVIDYEGGFYMYFLGMNRAGLQRIGLAQSTDGVHWSKHPGNPILDIGAAGDFDGRGLGEPSVVKVGNNFLMLYTGRNELEQRAIGLALSLDGINWQRQTPQGLQIARSNWDSEVQCDPTLMLGEDGKSLRIWFGGGDKRQPADHLNGQIGYAEVPLPEWAFAEFVAKRDWSTSPIPSTEILKGSYPVESDGTCWIGQEASMSIKPPFSQGIDIGGTVPFSIHHKGNEAVKRIDVTVFVNTKQVKELSFANDDTFNVTVPVPMDEQKSIAQVTVKVSDTVNPAKVGLGADERDLGILIDHIRPAM